MWWRIRGQGLLGVWIVAVLLLCLESVPCLAAETVQRAQVVASYPHDPAAFTQGLVFAGGLLYEGTGLYGSPPCAGCAWQMERCCSRWTWRAAFW